MRTAGKVIGCGLLGVLLISGWAFAQVAGKDLGEILRGRSQPASATDNASLVQIVELTKKQLPMDISGIGHVDWIYATGNALNYHVVPPFAGMYGIDPVILAAINDLATKRSCADFRQLLTQGVTLTYHYHSPRKRKKLAQHSVTANDCAAEAKRISKQGEAPPVTDYFLNCLTCGGK